MATEKHKKLAAFIKGTHNRLREESRVYGSQEAWNRHLDRKKDLQDYASSMQELATAHWKSENIHSDKSNNCRIQWVKKHVYSYFYQDGKTKFDNREVEIVNKIKLENVARTLVIDKKTLDCKKSTDSMPIISLLDVGSCYNPFGNDKNFKVTAIDLAPYCDQVYQCDFLSVNLGNEKSFSSDRKKILQLKYSSFDVVVFSLLLEYLPSPDQRFECCQKAYETLKPGGILIIITPDSKHVGANAKIIKSWRFVLSKMGFMRIQYEKLQHIHCISYRKCKRKEVASRWAEMQNLPQHDILFQATRKIFIPQDFQVIAASESTADEPVYSADELANGFDQLPQFH